MNKIIKTQRMEFFRSLFPVGMGLRGEGGGARGAGGRVSGPRLAGLGVHAGEWSALPCGSAAPPRGLACGLPALQREATTHNTHPPTHPPTHTQPMRMSECSLFAFFFLQSSGSISAQQQIKLSPSLFHSPCSYPQLADWPLQALSASTQQMLCSSSPRDGRFSPLPLDHRSPTTPGGKEGLGPVANSQRLYCCKILQQLAFAYVFSAL
jgi:hypothetical protein